MTLSNLTTHMKTCNGGLYTCNECGEGFPSTSALATHMTTHTAHAAAATGKQPYTCNECARVFPNSFPCSSGFDYFLFKMCVGLLYYTYAVGNISTLYRSVTSVQLSLCTKQTYSNQPMRLYCRPIPDSKWKIELTKDTPIPMVGLRVIANWQMTHFYTVPHSPMTRFYAVPHLPLTQFRHPTLRDSFQAYYVLLWLSRLLVWPAF